MSNLKSELNRLFFAIAISLAIWSLGFAGGNIAVDYTHALIWRRVAAIGWGPLYCLVLHYFILLTENHALLKKWWSYAILYFPAAVSVIVFSVAGNIAVNQYELFYSPSGWINVQKANFWDNAFSVHYICYSLVELLLIWKWGRRTDDNNKERQSRVIIISLFVALILGTLTDTILNKLLVADIPQLGPVSALVALGVIYAYIKRYGIKAKMSKNQIAEPGKILSEVGQEKLYLVISMVFVAGGLINFIFQFYFFHARFASVAPLCVILISIGFVFFLIPQLPLKGYPRDVILIVTVIASIPLMSLRYISNAGITVWAAPFIFVVLSVVFNRKRMMLWLLSSVLATQVWIWYKSPVAIVRVDSGDYAGRILIFILCIWLAYYVNNIYIRRLEENEAQIGFQKLISDISANFVTVNEENLESRIKDMISLCGKSFSVDRVLLVGFPGKIASMEWFTEGTGPVLGTLRDFNAKHFQWWLKQTYRNEIVHIPDVLLLPPEAEEMKTALTGKQVKSLLSVPVRKRGAIEAVLVFVSYKEARTWKKQHQDILRILANLLSDALTKVETEMEISHMAYYDSLTGLPNRFLFNNRLQQAIHHSKRTGKLLGVVLLDLDSFKTVNDTMGHDSGDEILKQVAQKLTGCLRQQDTVARFGGDEFLILVNMLEQVGDMRLIAEKIMKALELPLTVGGQEFFITASAGIAVYPVDGEDPELLIKNADVAMYASKDKGKNQYTLCSPSIKEDVLKRMKLTNSLYRALERNELELFYQPQVNPSTSLITGVEALIRWRHPELGMVSPGVFIPLAEKNGLIKPIGQWVLQTAARQLKAWQDKGFNPLRMAVNISVEQFRDSSFVRHVEKVLAETGLASGCLELEITEGIAVKEEGFIMSLLHVLKQLGVDIAIDDFGTEYSSLNRLKTLPVDRIKIDMQFVRNIAAGSKDEAIVKAIIQLAKNLKLEVIAEGVETEEECEFFSDNQCDHIQGYYYYRPMPANELEAILEKQYHFE